METNSPLYHDQNEYQYDQINKNHVIPSPISTTNTTLSTNSTGVQMIIDDDLMNHINNNNHNRKSGRNYSPKNGHNNNTDYAEITTFDRTMKESALQQIQREIEDQLNRLKNLNNKEFLAEMEVIKENLNLSDDEMINLTLMTLREVPIKHRNCQCCYIHIKQKYNNCLFTSPMSQNTNSILSNTEISGYHNGNDPESTYNDTHELNLRFNHDQSPNPSDHTSSTLRTPPTPKTPYDDPNKNKFSSLKALFATDNTPTQIDKAPTDIDSILESEEMEYKLPPRVPSNENIIIDGNNYVETTTRDGTSEHYQRDGGGAPTIYGGGGSTKMYIDTVPTKRNHVSKGDNTCLILWRRIRGFFLFVIPFIHTFISALIALIIFMEIMTESYNDNDDQCEICHKIHDIFYGPKVHDILMNDGKNNNIQLIAFYMILSLRISTILIWYILLIHTLLFHIISCCCCCQLEIECDYLNDCCCCLSSSASKLSSIGRGRNDLNHYYLMNNTPRKSKYRNKSRTTTTTILINSSISIDEHLRTKSRTITAINMLKFYLRMVVIPNVFAIFMHIFLFDDHEQFFLDIKTNTSNGNNWLQDEHINLYINIVVLIGFYWSLSDWFYFDRDNILCSWKDVYYVFIIDLLTNWMKFIYEITNFVLFFILCILLFIPLTIFILLRILICPCFFGYNNTGCLFCNVFETFIEFILKIIRRFYV